MSEQNSRGIGPIGAALLIGTASWYVLDLSGPILMGPEINPISALAGFGLGASGITLLAGGFRFLSKFLDWLRARKPIGLKGTAGWIKSLRELRHELVRDGWGPYWGSFKGKPVMSHFEASAFCVGPSGSGKSTKIMLTNALALKNFDKTIIDFKSDMTPVLMEELKKHGDVKILNLGGLFKDIVGDGDEYNPMNRVADLYWRPGGLQDITDVVHEKCLQILPEPKGNKGRHQNSHFDDGSRDLIEFAEQMVVLVHGFEATLGDVVQMLNDRQSLLRHAQWAAGRLEPAEADQ